MRTLRRKIRIDQDTTVSSIWKVPSGYRPGRDDAIILAHGAGNDMTSPFMAHFHSAFAQAGLLSVIFNFPYKEAGRKPPDRMPKLMAAYGAVIDRLRADELAPARLFIGGKSMGARVATLLA
jgi:predicted alpha/beta-hydrolase family hydrolase